MNASQFFLFIFLTIYMGAASQSKSLDFDVFWNGKKVGKAFFMEATSDGTNSLRLESTVRARMVRTIVAVEKEYAIFDNGILKESCIYRKVNGKEKLNKKHAAENGKYVITIGTNSSELNAYPITYNMLSLYSKEPANVRKVYSDKFESRLTIEKIEDHKYKVLLPDNNYNYYLYKDGILNEVQINHNLYSAKLILVRRDLYPLNSVQQINHSERQIEGLLRN